MSKTSSHSNKMSSISCTACSDGIMNQQAHYRSYNPDGCIDDLGDGFPVHSGSDSEDYDYEDDSKSDSDTDDYDDGVNMKVIKETVHLRRLKNAVFKNNTDKFIVKMIEISKLVDQSKKL